MAMQAADLRNLNHLPEAHFLDRSGLWRTLLKRQAGTILMVIVKIAPEDSPQMRFPENDDMVHANATYGGDECPDSAYSVPQEWAQAIGTRNLTQYPIAYSPAATE
jgi:hypothetical protein